MIRLANDVSLRGIRAEIVLAVLMVRHITAWIGGTLWITSGTDGEHMPKSLHYVGLGVDLVLRDLDFPYPEEQILTTIDRDIREALECEYDVVKYDGELRWHIEFQPKRRMP